MLKGVEKSEDVEKIEGVVKHLNYARHDEVNGTVLESGDFVHLGSYGAEFVKLALSQKLSIEGAAATMVDGHRAMEHPSKVNGVDVRQAPFGKTIMDGLFRSPTFRSATESSCIRPGKEVMIVPIYE